jgi:hypothetical protein
MIAGLPIGQAGDQMIKLSLQGDRAFRLQVQGGLQIPDLQFDARDARFELNGFREFVGRRA